MKKPAIETKEDGWWLELLPERRSNRNPCRAQKFPELNPKPRPPSPPSSRVCPQCPWDGNWCAAAPWTRPPALGKCPSGLVSLNGILCWTWTKCKLAAFVAFAFQQAKPLGSQGPGDPAELLTAHFKQEKVGRQDKTTGRRKRVLMPYPDPFLLCLIALRQPLGNFLRSSWKQSSQKPVTYHGTLDAASLLAFCPPPPLLKAGCPGIQCLSISLS